MLRADIAYTFIRSPIRLKRHDRIRHFDEKPADTFEQQKPAVAGLIIKGQWSSQRSGAPGER